MEHSQDGVETGGFTLELCSHCKVNGDSPFLFNPNLSQAPFSRDIFAPFTGTSSMTGATGDTSLPTPILSTSISGMTSPSSTTTITVFDLPVGNSVAASSGNSQGNSNSQGGNSQGSNSQGTGSGITTSTSAVTVSSGGSSTTSTTLPRTVTTKADTFASNPEPATLLLLGSGLAAGVFGRRAMRGRRV